MDEDIKVKVEELWDSVRSNNSEPTTDKLVTCSRCGFSYPLRGLLMLRRTCCRNCGAELDLVKALPSAQPDDLISKLSEIRSEYNCFDESEETYYYALSEAIRILSQRADSDTISRQTAIDALWEKRQALNNHMEVLLQDDKMSSRYLSKIERNRIEADINIIEGLPPARPQRNKGKWIRITQGAMPEQYICPFCHRTVESYGPEELLTMRYPYCHCGTDMRQV